MSAPGLPDPGLPAWASLHVPLAPRLGIVVHPEVPASVVDDASRVLAQHGVSALRRLARLMPAPGHEGVSDDEVAWFLERFGHEYTVLLAPARITGSHRVIAAAAASGVHLHTV